MTMPAPRGRLTPARRQIIDALLDRLLDLPHPARAQRMHELARSHRRIHAWLERLLAASDNPTSFLQSIFERAGDAALTHLELRREGPPPGSFREFPKSGIWEFTI